MTADSFHAFAGVFIAAFAVLSGWTLHRLWRGGKTPYARIVYLHGVRGFGGVMFLLMSITMVARRGETGRDLAISILVAIVTGIPIWLWAGYWWGRAMAFFSGVEPTDETSSAPTA